MKQSIATVALLMLLVGSHLAQADDGSWLEVRAWEGGKPWQQKNGKMAEILKYKPIADTVSDILPSYELKILNSYTNSSDVRSKDRNLTVFDLCKSHDCPFERATIIIDAEMKRIWIGFFSQSGEAISTRWYGNKQPYTMIPKDLIDEFNRADVN